MCGETGLEEFWIKLNDCVGSSGRNESRGDLNARVGNDAIEQIVEQHGVPGRNEVANDYW